MDPREALQLLDNLAASVNLNREQHNQLSEAIASLSRIVFPQSGVASNGTNPSEVLAE